MKTNVFCLGMCALFVALCGSVAAQQPKKVPRIGYVRVVGAPSPSGPNVEAFRRGLREILARLNARNFRRGDILETLGCSVDGK